MRMDRRVRGVRSNVSGISRTKQSFQDDTNINVIVSRYRQTGISPVINPREPKFGDFSNVGDYHSAMNRVIAAQELFDELPAKVRSAFRNDPAELIAAAQDPGKRELLAELGLLAEEQGDGDSESEVGSSGEAERSLRGASAGGAAPKRDRPDSGEAEAKAGKAPAEADASS